MAADYVFMCRAASGKWRTNCVYLAPITTDPWAAMVQCIRYMHIRIHMYIEHPCFMGEDGKTHPFNRCNIHLAYCMNIDYYADNFLYSLCMHALSNKHTLYIHGCMHMFSGSVQCGRNENKIPELLPRDKDDAIYKYAACRIIGRGGRKGG